VGIVQFQNEIQMNYLQFLLDFSYHAQLKNRLFPSEYVNRLYAMVNRNLSIPFRFVCFTENDSGIRNEVELQPLPELDLPVNLADAPERGWRKRELITPFHTNDIDFIHFLLHLTFRLGNYHL
jgi:hypothetical protein